MSAVGQGWKHNKGWELDSNEDSLCGEQGWGYSQGRDISRMEF